MGDQKRWFKVWVSITNDPAFGELDLIDVARWTLLGAFVAQHGTNGRLQVPGEGNSLAQLLRVAGRKALLDALRRLPNVHVEEHANRYGAPSEHIANEEGKSVNGNFTVTLSNWRRYQEDTTAAARMRTLRAKRRREVTPTPTPVRPVTVFKESPPEPPRGGGAASAEVEEVGGSLGEFMETLRAAAARGANPIPPRGDVIR